jgi:predicted lipoprotein
VDALMERIERMQREAREADLARGAPDATARPFDINEYTSAINAATATLEETNALIQNLEQSTQPDALAARLDVFANRGEGLVDRLASDLTRLIVIAGLSIAGAGIIIVLAAKLIPVRVRATVQQ